jgi:hypothetical protein
MKDLSHSRTLHIVVDVYHGIAVGAYPFRNKTEAVRHCTQLCKGRNLDEDDVQLFTTTVKYATAYPAGRKTARKRLR